MIPNTDTSINQLEDYQEEKVPLVLEKSLFEDNDFFIWSGFSIQRLIILVLVIIICFQIAFLIFKWIQERKKKENIEIKHNIVEIVPSLPIGINSDAVEVKIYCLLFILTFDTLDTKN